MTFELKKEKREALISDAMRKKGELDSRYLLPRSLDVLDLGLSSQFSLGSDLTSDKDDLGGENGERVDHAVDGVDEVEHLSLDGDSDDLDREVSSGLRRKARATGSARFEKKKTLANRDVRQRSEGRSRTRRNEVNVE